jgi:hydroxyacylglutathione hydrolase
MSDVVAEQVAGPVWRLACPFGEGGIVHLYYLDTPEPTLIDTGVKPTPAQELAPALKGAGFDIGAVRHVFNTHGHWDHMGGNQEVRRLAPQARFYIHPADADLLVRYEAHTTGYYTYPARIMGDRAMLEKDQALLRQNVDVPVPADVSVADGQVCSLGGDERLRVIHTPGHSLGSASYLLESAGALFTGDGVQGLGSRPGILPLIFEDSRAYRATIAKLSEGRYELLCMGHAFCGVDADSGRDPVRRGAAARRFLEESGEAAKAVEEAMRSALQEQAPSAAFLDVARGALAKVAGPLGVELDERGLSVRTLATLHAFYRELTGAERPA